MMKGLVHLSYKERMRDLESFSQERGKLRGEILGMCITTWWEGLRKTEQPDSSEWCPVKRQEGVGTT